MTALETRLDTILPTLATKADISSTDAKLGEFRVELAKAAAKTEAQLGELRAEFEKSALRTDTKLAELRSDMHKMNAEIRSWILPTMITIVGTMLAAIVGISQIYKGAVPPSPAAPPAPIIITIPGAVGPAAPASPK